MSCVINIMCSIVFLRKDLESWMKKKNRDKILGESLCSPVVKNPACVSFSLTALTFVSLSTDYISLCSSTLSQPTANMKVIQ